MENSSCFSRVKFSMSPTHDWLVSGTQYIEIFSFVALDIIKLFSSHTSTSERFTVEPELYVKDLLTEKIRIDWRQVKGTQMLSLPLKQILPGLQMLNFSSLKISKDVYLQTNHNYYTGWGKIRHKKYKISSWEETEQMCIFPRWPQTGSCLKFKVIIS